MSHDFQKYEKYVYSWTTCIIHKHRSCNYTEQ